MFEYLRRRFLHILSLNNNFLLFSLRRTYTIRWNEACWESKIKRTSNTRCWSTSANRYALDANRNGILPTVWSCQWCRLHWLATSGCYKCIIRTQGDVSWHTSHRYMIIIICIRVSEFEFLFIRKGLLSHCDMNTS